MKKIILLLILLLVGFNLSADYGLIDGSKLMYNYFQDFIADSTLGTNSYGRIDGEIAFYNSFITWIEWADTVGSTVGFPVDFITARDSGLVTIQDDVVIDSNLTVMGNVITNRIDVDTLYISGERFIPQDRYWGVEWDSDTDTYTRLGNFSAYDSTGQSPATYLPIHNNMKRCVVEDDGTVAYYLNPYNSTQKADGSAANLDGTDGQVMVEIPAFYYYDSWVGNNRRFYCSEDSISGFYKSDKFYVGAYEAVVSDNGVISDGDVSVNTTEDTLCSVAGYKPDSDDTIVEYRTIAENRGAGWHLFDYYASYIIEMLYLIEYADFNIQSTIGTGNTSYDAWSYANSIADCGLSNSDGNYSNASNSEEDALDDATDVNGSDSVSEYSSYRGIENIYGSLWQFVDGVAVDNDSVGATADSMYSELWTSTDYTDYSYLTTSPSEDSVETYFTMKGYLAETDGYMSDILSGTFYPTETSGSSSTYICAYYYTYFDDDPNSGMRVVLLGGKSNNSSKAGWYVNSNNTFSNDNSNIGTHLCLLLVIYISLATWQNTKQSLIGVSRLILESSEVT